MVGQRLIGLLFIFVVLGLVIAVPQPTLSSSTSCSKKDDLLLASMSPLAGPGHLRHTLHSSCHWQHHGSNMIKALVSSAATHMIFCYASSAAGLLHLCHACTALTS